MAHDDSDSETPPVGQQQGVDLQPFYRRCDKLRAKWDRLREESQSAGDKANSEDVVARVAGFVFAASATLVTTLVAAKVGGFVVSTTSAAILAAAATVATGIQASGMCRKRAEHHYERVRTYRVVRDEAANLKAQVEAGVTSLEAAFTRLDELIREASRRPEMR